MPFLFLLFLLFAAPAHADTHIVATINDDVITNADIADRMNLIFLSSGLGQDEATRKRVRERVLNNLIDEHLQVQEGKRYDIAIEKEEIDKALSTVARQNKMNADELEAYMKDRSVPKSTLVDQIRASLSWSKVVQRVLRQQVEVGTDEVNVALERIKANEGKPEYLMGEIFLAVENPTDDAKVQELANTLIERLKEGAPFASIAQQFSQGTGSINGGDLGWVQAGQLTGERDRAVRDLAVGQVSLPIKMPDGYYIMAKREERTVSAVDPKTQQVSMQQASMPVNGQPDAKLKESIARFTKGVPNCASLGTRINEFPEWSVQNLGNKRIGELPQWLAHIAETQKVDEPGEALQKNGYAYVLYVCERNGTATDRSTILAALGNEKLELQARRLLRDLRRAASVDVRS